MPPPSPTGITGIPKAEQLNTLGQGDAGMGKGGTGTSVGGTKGRKSGSPVNIRSSVRQLASLISSTVVFVFTPSLKRLSPGRIVYLTHPAGTAQVGVGDTEVIDA